MNGGIFGASEPYTPVRWPTCFVSLPGEPGRCVFGDARANHLYTRNIRSEIRPTELPKYRGKRSIDYPAQGNPYNPIH